MTRTTKPYVVKTPVPLKFAIGPAPHTAALLSGAVPIEGVLPEFIKVEPIIGAFRRMVRTLEFDVCEMAPTTYLIARARGAPFIALPLFLHRLFHHNGLLCRDDAGISAPRDLEGKRVGVRAWSVTTGVWKRGIMMDDGSLDVSRVTWVVDDEEAVPDLVLPPNVVHAPPGQSLASLWAAGELDAAFTGPAGIGRKGAPGAGWASGGDATASVPAHDMFPNSFAQAADFFSRTGIYPHHGLLVVKESVLAENPWIARVIFDAVVAAKAPLLEMLRSNEPGNSEVERYRQLATVVGDDPLPYGIAANRPSIDALGRYALAQGLLDEMPPLKTLFIDLD